MEWIVVLAMGGLFSAMGYLFGVKRLYFYGWMLGLANLASVYMSHKAGWTFMIPMALAAGAPEPMQKRRLPRLKGGR